MRNFVWKIVWLTKLVIDNWNWNKTIQYVYLIHEWNNTVIIKQYSNFWQNIYVIIIYALKKHSIFASDTKYLYQVYCTSIQYSVYYIVHIFIHYIEFLYFIYIYIFAYRMHSLNLKQSNCTIICNSQIRVFPKQINSLNSL